MSAPGGNPCGRPIPGGGACPTILIIYQNSNLALFVVQYSSFISNARIKL